MIGERIGDDMRGGIGDAVERLRRFREFLRRPSRVILDAPAFRGKTVLTAEQIEDVVAFLVTLRD